MTNEPIFELDLTKVTVDKRLNEAEIKQAIREVKRIAKLRVPKADWTVDSIDNTNRDWHRQKLPGERWRNIIIFEIDEDQKRITLRAILVRDNSTYAIVRRLYLAEDENED